MTIEDQTVRRVPGSRIPDLHEIREVKPRNTPEDARKMILERANENLAQACRYFDEGISWYGLMDPAAEAKYRGARSQLNELADHVEELRKNYVHSPEV